MENNRDEVMGIDIISLFKDEVQMAESDLAAMEYALTDYYEERISENRILFDQSEEQLQIANAEVFRELSDLNQDFLEKEQYEKCSVVKAVMETLISKLK